MVIIAKIGNLEIGASTAAKDDRTNKRYWRSLLVEVRLPKISAVASSRAHRQYWSSDKALEFVAKGEGFDSAAVIDGPRLSITLRKTFTAARPSETISEADAISFISVGAVKRILRKTFAAWRVEAERVYVENKSKSLTEALVNVANKSAATTVNYEARLAALQAELWAAQREALLVTATALEAKAATEKSEKDREAIQAAANKLRERAGDNALIPLSAATSCSLAAADPLAGW